MWSFRKAEPAKTPEEIEAEEVAHRETVRKIVHDFAEAAEADKIGHAYGPDRHPFVMAELIRRAHQRVLIYFHEFPSDVFAVPEVLGAIDAFIEKARPDGHISILTNEPIKVLPESALARRLAYPRVLASVVPALKKVNFEFVVADARSYWFRSDKQDDPMLCGATFCFGKNRIGIPIVNTFAYLERQVSQAA